MNSRVQLIKVIPLVAMVLLVNSCSGASTSATSAQTSSAGCVGAAAGASGMPGARAYGLMVGLGQGCGVLLLSGQTGIQPINLPRDAWMYRQKTGWSQVAPQPEQEFGPAIYDTAWNKVIMLGTVGAGFSPNQHDMLYDPASNKWQTKISLNRPRWILGAMLVYSVKSDRAMLFGGYDFGTQDVVGDTWSYAPRPDVWTKKILTTHPSARNVMAAAYDSKADRAILFGGGSSTETFADTWAYDFRTEKWTDLKPVNNPPARVSGSMVYDPKTNRVILFGGAIGPEGQEVPFGDTWALDLDKNTWSQLSPVLAPSARAWHAMAYESTSGKIVMFSGGVSRDKALSETWLFDPANNAWRQA